METRIKLLRILLCPFIFVWALILLIALSFFPLILLIPAAAIGLLLEPFIWILRKSGSQITGFESPFSEILGNNAVGHFLMITVHIWSPFAITYLYIKDGTVIMKEF